MIGTVLFGINNIYTVECGTQKFECRIKGKTLDTEHRYYNPIAPGDLVEIEYDQLQPNQGLIIERKPRRSSFTRWNKKRKRPQIIAANIDALLCITSPENPPFRPRFIDRVCIVGEKQGLETIIVLNKDDLCIDPQVQERLSNYERIGYTVISCSTITLHGVERLKSILKQKRTVLIGQSGVGKSSLINVLIPGIRLTIGEISLKHDRGNHTTVFSMLLKMDECSYLIDTPGIREMELTGIGSQEIQFLFPEFQEALQQCGYSSCTHTHEPDCAVKQKVVEGEIHHDRYETYVRVFEVLAHSEKHSYLGRQ